MSDKYVSRGKMVGAFPHPLSGITTTVTKGHRYEDFKYFE
jgi:hypothetical protein